MSSRVTNLPVSQLTLQQLINVYQQVLHSIPSTHLLVQLKAAIVSKPSNIGYKYLLLIK